MVVQTLENSFVFSFLFVCHFSFPIEIINMYLYLEGDRELILL